MDIFKSLKNNPEMNIFKSLENNPEMNILKSLGNNLSIISTIKTKKTKGQDVDKLAIETIEKEKSVKFIEINMCHGNLHLRGYSGGSTYKTFNIPNFEDHETSIRWAYRSCDIIMERGSLPLVAEIPSGVDAARRELLQLRRVMPDTVVPYARRTKRVLQEML